MQSAQLLAIARQIKALATAPPDGVRYVPGDALTEVLADVDGPVGTPYEGGSFRVKLVLGSDFPSAPPKGSCAAAAAEAGGTLPGSRALCPHPRALPPPDPHAPLPPRPQASS